MLASIPAPGATSRPTAARSVPLMRSWRTYTVLCLIVLLFCVPRARAETSGLPAIDARAYILMNADTGAILAAKNAYLPYAIASITKLMTLYLLFKDIDKGHLALNQHFVPCQTALRTGGSTMFLHPGLSFTVAQMILGMTVPSGNDAAVEAAHLVAGSVPAFVADMNRTARRIGMLSTTYYNPDGLPHPNNMASPYDIAVLTRAIMTQFPQFMPFFWPRQVHLRGHHQPQSQPAGGAGALYYRHEERLHRCGWTLSRRYGHAGWR